MKKILIILPCLIALYSCDKINFHEKNINFYEENIKCLVPTEHAKMYVYFDSLKIDSKQAVLQTKDKTIELKRYITKEYPKEFILYKTESEDFPLFLHYSKNMYGIGMSADKLGPCTKVSNNDNKE